MSLKFNPFTSNFDSVSSPGIGKPISGGTSGSVLFVDSSGNLAQDNANFNWDDSGNQLNLSSPTALGQMNILGVGGGYLRIGQGPTLAHGSIDLGVKNPKAGLFRTNSTNAFLWYSTSTGDTVLNNAFGSPGKVLIQYLDTTALEVNSSRTVTVNGFTSSAQGLIVKGAASQTANLTEWQDSSGNVLASIGPAGKTTIGVTGSKNPYVDILVGVGTGLNNESASMRLRQNAVDGNGFVLNLGVSNVAVGGSNQGYGYIQASYWGGTYNNPLRLQPQGGQIMCGDVSQGHDWALSARTAIAVASPTNPGSGGAGTIMGKIAFNANGYSGEMAWIGGIYDKSGFYQGAGLVFNTISGADVAGFDGTEKMRISSDGAVTINGFSSSTTGLTIKGAASQTATLQEWQNSGGTIMAYVTKDGQIYSNVQAAVANLYLANAYNADCIYASKTGGTGNVLTAALETSQSHGVYLTNTSAGTYLQGSNQYGVYSQTSHACDNPAVIAGNFIAAHTATASGTYGHLAIGVNASAASSMTGGTYGAAGKFTCASANVAGIQVIAHASQTSNLQEWQNSSGTAVSYIRPDGSLKPASLADSSAVNDSIYYSTTASKLVYKDSGGTVNALY